MQTEREAACLLPLSPCLAQVNCKEMLLKAPFSHAGRKKASCLMLPYLALCRDSYIEGLSAPVVGHDLVSFRMNDFVSKAGLACDLRKESIERVHLATESLRVQLSGFQRLQDRMHEMVRLDCRQHTQAACHIQCFALKHNFQAF